MGRFGMHGAQWVTPGTIYFLLAIRAAMSRDWFQGDGLSRMGRLIKGTNDMQVNQTFDAARFRLPILENAITKTERRIIGNKRHQFRIGFRIQKLGRMAIREMFPSPTMAQRIRFGREDQCALAK